ncbi:hypothetical protein FG145_004784, partial [Escherichia coli]|nr:hypothetical protein [Escherichia coli]
MNILFLSNASGYGGSERTLEILAKHMAKKNKVTVFVQNEIHRDKLNESGICVIEADKGWIVKKIIKDLYLIYDEIMRNDGVIA